MTIPEYDTQLSAMFDDELVPSECELLARRLSRDEQLKRQWARYALIGAVMRAEPLRPRRVGPTGRLAGSGVAERVALALAADAAPALAGGRRSARPDAPNAGRSSRWLRPLAGLGVAAGVAAVSVLWLQSANRVLPGAAPVASVASNSAPALGMPATSAAATTVAATYPSGPSSSAAGASAPGASEIVVAPAAGSLLAAAAREPESYVVPMPASRLPAAPVAQLANYVVAHSEYSTPLTRRSLLSALVAAEVAEAQAQDAAQNAAANAVGGAARGTDVR
jgi:sigma-E factor negative regulatory protein RseA